MLKRPDQLSPECRDFQRHYEGGRSHPHLADCDTCREFVDFVGGLRSLGLSSPLGDDLRTRLRGLPAQEDGLLSFPRVPELPMPAGLAHRLRQIARDRARELPIWIRSPRYAIAASYLLTLLVGATLGNPAAWASNAGGRFELVGSAIEQAKASGKERWSGVGETATENYHLTRDYLRTSTSSLLERWTELVAGLNEPETTDDGAEGWMEPDTPNQGEEL